MKKVRKVFALLLCLAMLLSFAACAGNGENTAPQITGVADMTVEAGIEINVLEGVTALDAEDGDVTSKIVIDSTPTLNFKNGKAIPEKPGTYELAFSVTDKGGMTAEAYATLTVDKKAGDAVVYKEFDFNAQQTVNSKGWTAKVAAGASATGTLKQGAYVFEIASAGSSDSDVQLVLSGMAVKAADYRVKVWAKSTANTYMNIIAKDENAKTAYGSANNLAVGQQIAPLELNFTAKKAGSAELAINLGKITPNSEAAPENYTVIIDKIEVYEITGQESKTSLYTNDFASADAGAVVVSAGDGAAAGVIFESGAARADIAAYPTSGGVWSIKTDMALGGNQIEQGQKYYYSFTVKAQNTQSGECLVESATQNDSNRVHFNSFYVGAGETCVVTGVFTADRAVADPVIRLQIGNPSDGVYTNSLVIDNVEFGKVQGDLASHKTTYTFTAFGSGTANEKNNNYPWATFNGTDEDNEKGVGTIWTENGSLFYRIDQGSVTDWHNKLICGYGGNALNLKAHNFYTVEITVKADKAVSCGFFLNPVGKWEPLISETMNITTQEQTISFTTTDTFIADTEFEMLFQFGSEATAQLGDVTIEIMDLTIYQTSAY